MFNLNMFKKTEKINFEGEEYIPNKLEILNKDDIDIDEIYSIDTSENIIICTLDDNHIFKKELNGTISLICDNIINLVPYIKNTSIQIPIYFPVKLSIPYGIKLNFTHPLMYSYYKNIYDESKYRTTEEKNTNFIINTLEFIIEFDLELYKKYNEILQISKGMPIINIEFIPTLSIFEQKKINSIYILKDTEIYREFNF